MADQSVPSDQQLDQQIAAESALVQAAHDGAGKVAASINANDATGLRPGQLAAYQRQQAAASGNAPAPAGGPVGGYRFSPTQIESQLAKCNDLIHGLTYEDLPNALKIARVQPPAKDHYSVTQANAVAALGNRAVQRVNNQIAFVQKWHDMLLQSRTDYLEQEHLSADGWTKISGGLAQ